MIPSISLISKQYSYETVFKSVLPVINQFLDLENYFKMRTICKSFRAISFDRWQRDMQRVDCHLYLLFAKHFQNYRQKVFKEEITLLSDDIISVIINRISNATTVSLTSRLEDLVNVFNGSFFPKVTKIQCHLFFSTSKYSEQELTNVADTICKACPNVHTVFFSISDLKGWAIAKHAIPKMKNLKNFHIQKGLREKDPFVELSRYNFPICYKFFLNEIENQTPESWKLDHSLVSWLKSFILYRTINIDFEINLDNELDFYKKRLMVHELLAVPKLYPVFHPTINVNFDGISDQTVTPELMRWVNVIATGETTTLKLTFTHKEKEKLTRKVTELSIQALKEIRNLHYLSITVENGLVENSFFAFVTTLKCKKVSINFKKDNLPKDRTKLFSILSNCLNLRELRFQTLTDRDLEMISHFPFLEKLYVKKSLFSERGLQCLPYFKQLRKLKVESSKLSSEIILKNAIQCLTLNIVDLGKLRGDLSGKEDVENFLKKLIPKINKKLEKNRILLLKGYFKRKSMKHFIKFRAVCVSSKDVYLFFRYKHFDGRDLG